MSEEIENASKESASVVRPRWQGESLYEGGRRALMLCFFAIFVLIAHQKLFGGYQRSKAKLIVLMCLAPVVLLGGLCCFIGWWRMKLAGAFVRPEIVEPSEPDEPVVEERRSRRRREEDAELLPWQRRDR